ncbi:MAG: hypothetical protein V9F04_05415 [Dermatophilaceae bacterium]
MDEYGNETDQRRISPEAWNEVFRAQMEGACRAMVPDVKRTVPKSTFKAPGQGRANCMCTSSATCSANWPTRSTCSSTCLEAPALAFVMAFFLRYYRNGVEMRAATSSGENDNIPQFLFIAVIVALFLGLTVSGRGDHP